MSIPDYFGRVRQAIEKIDRYGFAESIDIREEIRAGKQAVLTATVVLVDGSCLFIREYIDAKYQIDTSLSAIKSEANNVPHYPL